MTISSLLQDFRAGIRHPAEVLKQLAQNIDCQDASIGSYLSYNLDDALRLAEQADVNLPLGGIPIAIKDNINVLGQPCTCGSRFLSQNYQSPYHATVIKKLLAAGAIPFGRTNMDEFAMGSATENSALKITRNPHDTERIPGGSSGGSAACVAADLAIASLGSDTGGSIRQPASHCGVVGLKPTYGRVSRYGLVAFASSLDQIGPITKSVEDAAHLLQAIAGYDSNDSTSVNTPVPDYVSTLNQGIQGMKLGIPREYFADGIEPAVRQQINARIAFLENQGAEIIDISLPHTNYAVATYYILAPAEAASNLARFDGVRYGKRSAHSSDILSLYQYSREEGFGAEVKRRIILGTYVLSSGYYDAYYGKAQQVRALIASDFTQAFKQVDAIISPITPAPARRLHQGESAEAIDPLQDYLSDIFTIAANLAGIPAISVPCGTVAYDGNGALPIGLQIMAPHFAEAKLLQIAQVASL